MREIVLDTETTGLDVSRDRIVEIGCIELVNHLPTGRHYHQYVNPERDIPADAFAVHGLSQEFLADKPRFAEIAPALAEFLAGARLIIHNAAFDIAFINRELELCGYPPIGLELVIDTLELARTRHPFAPNSLDALCRRYGVDASNRTLHGALIDCELLAAVYLELIGGRQPVLRLDQARELVATSVIMRPARQRPEPLAPLLTREEREAHEAFVATLGPDALWRTYGVAA